MRTTVLTLAVALLIVGSAPAAEPTKAVTKDSQQPVLRLGAVCGGPNAVTVFRSLRYYLAKNGMPIEFTLYSNYDGLVEALHKGHVDIAWNSPLAHGKFHVLAGDSMAVCMRDVDCGYRVKLIVRKDANISSVGDLMGKTMIFGSCDSADCTVLPVYLLKKEGVSFDKVKVVSLHNEVDEKGVPCHSQQHVWQALVKGRGQAGVISQNMWKRLQTEQPKEADQFKEIWTSPPFSHCVFTARKDFDKATAERFSKLMLAMDGKDPLTAEILKLEHCGKWVSGGQPAQEGFEHLFKALRESPKLPFQP